MGIFIIALILTVLIESSLTTLPLTLLVILFLAVSTKRNEVFVLAFFSGLILDILSFSLIGLSSLYFVTFVFLIYVYQKKFEIDTINFIFIFSFVGSLIYLLISGVSFVIIQSFLATLIASSSYIVFRKFNKKQLKYA